MPKYHIGSNGPSACRARIRPCPFGGESGRENHFDSKDEAENAHQKVLSKEHGVLKTSKRNQKTSDSDLLAPITITIPDKAVSSEEFLKTLDSESFSRDIKDFCDTLYSGEIPHTLHYSISKSLLDFSDSSDFTDMIRSDLYMQSLGIYGKIMKDTAADIAENVGDGVVLDPMAGSGWGAKALREAGVKTIASDDSSWKISNGIEKLDAVESLRKYGDKISHILISWAPHGSDIDVRLLREVRSNYPHITIINIGEGPGGCTGSEEFWDELEDLDPDIPVRYDTTMMLHDQVTFGK